jgi:methyl-accepting chemotaxis protein
LDTRIFLCYKEGSQWQKSAVYFTEAFYETRHGQKNRSAKFTTSQSILGRIFIMSLRLKPKLIAAFLAVGLIPFAIVSILSLNKSSTALEQSSFNQLDGVRGIKKAQIEQFFAERQGDTAVLAETATTLMMEAFLKLDAIRSIKKSQIQNYLNGIRDDVLLLAKNDMMIDGLEAFEGGWDEFGPTVTQDLQRLYIKNNPHPAGEKHLLNAAQGFNTYNKAHAKYHPWLRDLLLTKGYYDIFLVNHEGKVAYTVYKELDFGTNLKTGKWKNSGLAEVYNKLDKNFTAGAIAFSDMAPYAPSAGAPAGFIGTPIFDHEGARHGMLIFQMPLDKINAIMAERTGLGKTGETYLVGPDKLMRSDSFLDPKYHTVTASFADPVKGKADTEAIRLALKGKNGSDIIMDYNGNPVLSSYDSLDAFGITWALLAEVDVAEAFVPKDNEGKEFYKKYVDAYGYYDLFLILPDGYIFYTAFREPDYQTNIISGKFKDSNLGDLVRNVFATNKFGIADFAPYAPSNGTPAGFVAAPIVHPDNGETEMVVALQLSLDAINSVMQNREGMGETGETYLVGSDKLMRSDSFLDPEGHSVQASFANPDKGSVNTDAATNALAGKTDSEIIMDYNGNPVLSSYTPLAIGDTTWALIAEIDEAEAFATIFDMQTLMLIIAVVGIAAIGAAGYITAASLANPVVGMTDSMGVLAGGDLDADIPSQDRTDEIGEMAAAVQVFKENAIRVKQMEEEAREQEKRAAEEKTRLMNQMADDFQASVGGVVQTVSSASTELQSSAQSMTAISEETSSQATAVAAASEEASTNVQTVASAAEELSSSISEISRQVSQSTSIAGSAVNAAGEADEMIQGLAMSAQKIGEVVALITDIADQTNLLALNATIEAARAGEAGKGFAVVASEVKNLANQTAKATEEISSQIGGIQGATQDSVKAIQGITKTIGEISEISSAIAAAVEEQGAATSEIARNVEQAAAGTGEVSSNIQGVTQAAAEAGSTSAQVLGAANELSEQSELLKTEVDKFMEQVRKA